MIIEAMKLALEALEGWANYGKWVWPETALEQAKRNTNEAIATLRAAIEQPDQEPVAWMCSDESLLDKGYLSFSRDCRDTWNIPVFTAPPPRQWQGLTDEVIEQIAKPYYKLYGFDVPAFARAIEAKLKEENT